MQIQENVPLRRLNTFGIPATARWLAEIQSESQLIELMNHPLWKQEQKLIVGGGSNWLFTHDIDRLVLLVRPKGIRKIGEDDHHVWLEVAAGEVWDDVVEHAVHAGWGGIENLSLIPGTMGAAPIQNIGAYGAEISQSLEALRIVALDSGKVQSVPASECQLGYRESAFKGVWREKFFISSVTLRLTRKSHLINTSYGALEEVLRARVKGDVTLRDVRDAVIEIRRSKLPDPAVIGNAGSFFKNPTVGIDVYNRIREAHPTAPSYPIDNQNVKVPAGWLIEQCGWKGFRRNDVGVHARQALVLVNYGEANGGEIRQLAEEIRASVREKFSVELTPEVNIF